MKVPAVVLCNHHDSISQLSWLRHVIPEFNFTALVSELQTYRALELNILEPSTLLNMVDNCPGIVMQFLWQRPAISYYDQHILPMNVSSHGMRTKEDLNKAAASACEMEYSLSLSPYSDFNKQLYRHSH